MNMPSGKIHEHIGIIEGVLQKALMPLGL